MSLSTKLFLQYPWKGGQNTTYDEAVIPANQLSKCDDLVLGERGSKKRREGINFGWDDTTAGSLSIIGMHDFWYGTSSKLQKYVSIASDGSIRSYSPSSGAATVITGGTSWTTPTIASMETMNNLCIMAVNGSGNVLKKWSASGSAADLGGTPPQASILRQHLGRLWCNDKTNLDRLHYCTTGNPEEWNGAGDSGAIDIGVGDGDDKGITAIMPSFRGELFVAKGRKLYRISGNTPENFKVENISNGIGCVSHNSCFLVDQTDIYFMSERGVHSLVATASFGDFDSSYVSYDIQKTFNEDWRRDRLAYSHGAYLPTINSVMFAVTDSTISDSSNKALWLYNITEKAWYRWPNISCQSLMVARDSDKIRPYFGGINSKIAQGFTGFNYDRSAAGATVNIEPVFSTGLIFPDQNPYKTYTFNKFCLIYKPQGTHNVTVTAKIDNYDEQSLSFSQTGSTDLLGSTFTLGTSILGYNVVLAPYTQQIDGLGRGIKFTFRFYGTQEPLEVWGFGFEYADAEVSQEVIT